MLKKVGTMLVILSLFFLGISSLSVHADEFLELVKDASPEKVQEAINAGADVNAIGEKERTALMVAAGNNNNPDVFEILINNGANVNAKMQEEKLL
ncbi:MAG: ankyrin repeat domain-containing protein [Candidatus Woesearchaeota archaeon]